MSERLLRFTRNDNVPCAIKVHGRCHWGLQNHYLVHS